MVQIDLLQELKHGPTYDHAIICTYEFDADFFERYALRQCKVLRECETISVALDTTVYQSLCEANSYRPTDINRLYLVQDFAAGGVFHPKLILLAAPTCGKLLIGSANFTRAGFTHNAELVSIFSYEASQNKSALGIFQAAFEFIRRLAMRVTESTFASNVEEVTKQCPWLIATVVPSIPFVHNMDESLLRQMQRALGSDVLDEYVTVSPYFDGNLAMLDAVVDQWHAKVITIITQTENTTLDGQALARWHGRHKNIKLQVKLVDFPKEQRFRPLHAKLHLLRRARRFVCLTGSANCTRAGMLEDCRTGNLEAALLFVGSDSELLESILGRAVISITVADRFAELGKPVSVPPAQTQLPLRLAEVLYEQDRLRVKVNVLGTVGEGKFLLELSGFLGDKEHTESVPLAADMARPQPVSLTGKIDSQRLLETTAVKARVLLEAGDNYRPVSGWRWVENIDVDGRNVRIARAIRDARENPVKFAEVLQALTERDDAGGLIDFLLYCNIPLEGFSPQSRLPVRPPAGEFTLGPQTRQACRSLREAVQTFFERHRRKLQRHVDEPEAAGAANFSHILETVTRALDYHLAYELALIPPETVLVADQWKDFRDQAAAVFSRFEDLLQCLSDYREGLPKRRIPPVLAESFQTMRLASDSLQQKAIGHVAKVRATAKVRTSHGSLVEPPIFTNDLFSSANWDAYISRIGQIFDYCAVAAKTA